MATQGKGAMEDESFRKKQEYPGSNSTEGEMGALKAFKTSRRQTMPTKSKQSLWYNLS